MRQHLFRLSVVVGLCSGSAIADDLPGEDVFLQSFPVVLSASRLSQPLSEAPNAMTVIDRDMIVASGFRNIADLFKLVPGMYVSYYKGSQPIVSYHGSTDQYARRMQVMIDGRSVYMPPLSMIDWASLPITINDIERIEVIRGPAAASHGANSLQGVISIVTREAGGVDGKGVSITRGNKGVNDVSARFGKRGETLDYRMTVAYRADDGYDDLTVVPNGLALVIPTSINMLNNSNDSNRARMMNFRASYHPGGGDTLDVQFGFNRDVQGVGFTDSRANPFHDLIADASFLQLNWTRLLDDASELKFSYYHTRQNQSEAFTLVRPPFTGSPVAQSVQTRRDELEVQHMLSIGEANRLVYGAGWRRDRVVAQGDTTAMLLLALPQFYSSSSSEEEYRIFAHNEWRISPAFLLNTGAMFEQDRMGHQSLSPRASLNVRVRPGHTLRMGASVAYRTPVLGEERYRLAQPGVLFVPEPVVTSPGLLPEKMLSREIGYLGEFRDWDSSLDIRIFSDRANDGIYAAPTAFQNGVSALYRGVEATLKSAFGDASQLALNFAHERAHSNLVALSGTSDSLAESIPRNTLSALYTQRLQDGFSFSAAYYFQAAMQPHDRGPVDFQPVQRRADVRFAQSFKPGQGLNGEISWVIQNLFDQDYTEYIASNVFNRRSYVNLALDW